VAITKNWPASDVRALAALGVKDVGENRDQEAAPKAAQCADLGLRWHFVGRLQTNKARSVADYADVVHSVDRSRLVDALSRAAQASARTVGCLVQVSLDADTARGGALAADVPALADQVAASAGLELRGVMGVAPLGPGPEPTAALAPHAFALLAEVSAVVLRGHPDASWVSAGMSGDLEAAIACGATHVRVGSAILGARRDLR
jgi:pyridoxal phosphate enzyme (YggS family)